METWFPFPHSIAGDCDQVIVVVGELEVSGCRRGLPDPADHRKQRDQREGVRGSQLPRITEIGIKPREDGRLRRRAIYKRRTRPLRSRRCAFCGRRTQGRRRLLPRPRAALGEDQPFFGQVPMAMANRLLVSWSSPRTFTGPAKIILPSKAWLNSVWAPQCWRSAAQHTVDTRAQLARPQKQRARPRGRTLRTSEQTDDYTLFGRLGS